MFCFIVGSFQASSWWRKKFLRNVFAQYPFLYALLAHYVQIQMLLATAKAEVQQEQRKHEKHYMSDNQKSKYHSLSWWTLVLVFFTALLISVRRKNPLESKHWNINLKIKYFTSRCKYFMQCKNHTVLQDSKQAVPERTKKTVVAECKVTLTRNCKGVYYGSLPIFNFP